MLEENVLITTILQIWCLQFLLIIIDTFTDINISQYGNIIIYSLTINLVTLFYVFSNKLSSLKKQLFLTIGICCGLFYILHFICNYILFFNFNFWLLNFHFSILFLFIDYARKDIFNTLDTYQTALTKNNKRKSSKSPIHAFGLSKLITYILQLKNNTWQKNLNLIFQTTLTAYLILFLTNEFYSLKSGILNTLLTLTIISGIISIIYEKEEKKKKTTIKSQKLTQYDYIYSITIGIIGGILIHIKTSDLEWLSYVISFISTILIIFVSFLILEDDTPDKQNISKT